VPIGDAIFAAISKVKRALGDASAQLGLRKWRSQKTYYLEYNIGVLGEAKAVANSK
jgi:hypothetical protein